MLHIDSIASAGLPPIGGWSDAEAEARALRAYNRGIADGRRWATEEATTAEPQRPAAVPPGRYIVQITASHVAWPAGEITLDMNVVTGPWQGIALRQTIALGTDEGQRMLSSICRATGVMQLSDTAQLHFKPFGVHVAVGPDGRNIVTRAPWHGTILRRAFTDPAMA